MKTPKFLRTGKVKLILNRYPVPTYVKGKLTEGTPQQVEIEANVQPFVKGNGTTFLPEEAKIKRALNIWSASEIKQKIEHNVTSQADRFFWEGEEYEVIKAVRWNMGVLSHYEALAVILDPE